MAMPFAVDGDRGGPVQLELRPSAVLDLSWLVYQLAWDRPEHIAGLREEVPVIARELADTFGEPGCTLTDLSILAERVGLLLTDEIDPFLASLEKAAQLDGVGLELRSETPQDRQATLDRLELLRRDPALARRYAELLGRIWNLVRPEWDRTGREVVRRTLADWSDRQRRGAGLLDLIPKRHIVRMDKYQHMLAERRRIVLSPVYFSSRGGLFVDMTTFLHVGIPARPAEYVADSRRRESEMVADSLKVLSDPTRVSLLRELADEPMSVMDLSRRFGLAQPTVSNHVRLLRDAALLESQKDGPRVVYTVDRQRLEQVLNETRHILLEH